MKLEARTLADMVLEIFTFEVDNKIVVKGEGIIKDGQEVEDTGSKAFQPSPTPKPKKTETPKKATPKKEEAPAIEIPEGGLVCHCCGGRVSLRAYQYDKGTETVSLCKKCSADLVWARNKVAKGDESQIKPKHTKVMDLLAGFDKGATVKL
jgi:hypothetical protein